MGMDLVRRRDSRKWSCSNALWLYLLDAAMKSGWKPSGTENKSEEKGNHDAQDYHSDNGQIVTSSDAEQIHKCLQTFIRQHNPTGIEKEVLESFIEWVARRDENNTLVDVPGFIIR